MAGALNTLSDTHPKAEQVQIGLLRAASPARRAAIALAVSAQIVKLSRDAIQRAHPGWSELEVKLFWVELHYGQELAARVRSYLSRREPA